MNQLFKVNNFLENEISYEKIGVYIFDLFLREKFFSFVRFTLYYNCLLVRTERYEWQFYND